MLFYSIWLILYLEGRKFVERKLLIGNEAVARGLFEAGCNFVSSYPGTPSTEITEFAAVYDEVYAEWAPNEKVACEAAFGASFAGGRAFSAMKHVGMNVAADLLFTASYTGVNGGFVMAIADDQGMHSSQNEQDSRHYAAFAKVPMLEPFDSESCRTFTKRAFELSEMFDTPVLLRLSTRISHSQSMVSLEERVDVPLKAYEKNAEKYVMVPGNARKRHVVVEKRTEDLISFAETDDINREELYDTKIGIVTAGIAYQYAKEAFGEGASYLNLGMVYPLPVEKIKAFACKVDRLIIIEELDDILETHCKKHGIACEGKELFSLLFEYSPSEIREKILGVPRVDAAVLAPVRPPVLCPACPHRGLFYVLKKMDLLVSGDIGCYALGSMAPLSSLDSCICMGESVSGLHGIVKVGGEAFARKSVAVIGDSTFCHSGVTGLMNIVYNGSPSTVIIVDNSITGMTGHQQNPTTGLTLKNEPAPVLDLELLCKAIGVKRVRVVDPYETKELEGILGEELLADEPSVVIAKRPCALLPVSEKHASKVVSAEKCKKCKACMKIGCPAIRFSKEEGAVIDPAICVGCGLCQSLCVFGAIED